ncbi:peptide methionine sulfoxide reductase A3 isoform X1 [Gossypium arboreum]|uniref:peptide methionine sulfoxide reductase A3 isoform X1 n=1 Tax=Gossypium arboreum TaxID=29729 RepID=UPI0022F1D028|nr:peptide methionine sulfoxide reductase A3 isoform X1 [Gossypium arboreum]
MNILKNLGFGANNKPTASMENCAIAQGPEDDVPPSGQQFAQFGAGCFWGVELAFQRVSGITKTEVGYSQGFMHNPSYEDVCSGTTNHSEVVRVQYDRNECSYDTLLHVFWARHDPTTLNRQVGFYENLWLLRVVLRAMMWGHSTDLGFTFTAQSRRRQQWNPWKNSRNSSTERLLLKFCRPGNFIEQRNITSSTLQREVVLVVNNLLRKDAMILSDAMAKLPLFLYALLLLSMEF